MKLSFDEINFVKSAVEVVSIKASDALAVSKIIEKLEKESSRLMEIEVKKQAAAPTMEAAK